jgi:hypothetical protein
MGGRLEPDVTRSRASEACRPRVAAGVERRGPCLSSPPPRRVTATRQPGSRHDDARAPRRCVRVRAATAWCDRCRRRRCSLPSPRASEPRRSGRVRSPPHSPSSVCASHGVAAFAGSSVEELCSRARARVIRPWAGRENMAGAALPHPPSDLTIHGATILGPA